MSALSEYLVFFRNNRTFLAFGFLMALTSSAGQTYFIGVFGPGIRESFALSHSQWGAIYMAGTLLSALILPWTGDLLDRIDLRIYTAAVTCGLVIACLFISFTPSAWLLVISILLIRQFGQGLASHTAITSMARYIYPGRGKAIAIATMGLSVGEACLPVLAVIAISAFGWRVAYQLTGLAVLLGLPLALLALRNHSERHKHHMALQSDEDAIATSPPSTSRRQMLREGRFYLLLPAFAAQSMVVTGLFFHHLTLAEAKSWSGIWVTGNYWIYALVTVITSLVSGPLVDRFSAARVLPWFPIPLTIGMLLLYPAVHPLWVLPYMALMGISTGIYFTSSSALWAELYGTRYLGGIKSLVGALTVFASALGPVFIGVILDLGFSFELSLVLFSLFYLIATALLIAGLKNFR